MVEISVWSKNLVFGLIWLKLGLLGGLRED